MPNIRLTKKLKEAIAILAYKTKGESPDEAFLVALQREELKPEDLYRAMGVMRYKWDVSQDCWIWEPLETLHIKRVFSIVRKIADEQYRKADP